MSNKTRYLTGIRSTRSDYTKIIKRDDGIKDKVKLVYIENGIKVVFVSNIDVKNYDPFIDFIPKKLEDKKEVKEPSNAKESDKVNEIKEVKESSVIKESSDAKESTKVYKMKESSGVKDIPGVKGNKAKGNRRHVKIDISPEFKAAKSEKANNTIPGESLSEMMDPKNTNSEIDISTTFKTKN